MASLPLTTTIPPAPLTHLNIFQDVARIKRSYPHLSDYLCDFLHHAVHPLLNRPSKIEEEEEDATLICCLQGKFSHSDDPPDFFTDMADYLGYKPAEATTDTVEELKASMDEQFASIRATLATLTNPPPAPTPAKPSAQPPPKPTPPPHAPPKVSAPVAKAPKPTPAPTTTPSYTSAACKPVRPSLIVTRKHTDEMAPLAIRHSPSTVCAHLNAALASTTPQVTLSTARWTKNNNLVVTAGPDTTVHQLNAASTLISDTLSSFLSTSADTPLPVSAKENVRWSHILINNIPTGVTASRGAYSPQECQDTLTHDNPVYRSLRLARLPSWVKRPDGYAAGSSSSLVVTFEDPSGVALQDLLAHGSLFAFGQEGHLRRWKQRPRAKASPPSHSDGPSKPT
ncbi:hypothetical protein EDB92DRAFT_1947171 [Lactarius akahatsu]|uniref:Uncharacterized protein n=1 Tax=Lactarius akahatsu TaxID=416441 RepID=A0AAD4LFJ4_9AGAM|nr:hypothetical protein EDB92DRAFT_1947171 [Lactarius akahatsu]